MESVCVCVCWPKNSGEEEDEEDDDDEEAAAHNCHTSMGDCNKRLLCLRGRTIDPHTLQIHKRESKLVFLLGIFPSPSTYSIQCPFPTNKVVSIEIETGTSLNRSLYYFKSLLFFFSLSVWFYYSITNLIHPIVSHIHFGVKCKDIFKFKYHAYIDSHFYVNK